MSAVILSVALQLEAKVWWWGTRGGLFCFELASTSEASDTLGS